jgi:hypothetical protein
MHMFVLTRVGAWYYDGRRSPPCIQPRSHFPITLVRPLGFPHMNLGRDDRAPQARHDETVKTS